MIRDYHVKIIFVSFLYSLFLVLYFPIDDTIIDRINYLIYAENSLIIFNRYYAESFLALSFNEPIWLLINIFLSYFFNPENVLRVIIFFSSFTVSFLLLRNNLQYFWILLLILIFPNVIKNFIIHLRQGLAIAFFLIGWFSLSRSKKYFFFILTPFVHTSFFLVIAMYFLTLALQKLKFAFDVKFIVYFILGFVISFGLAFIASLLGMRQATEYEFIAADSSGLGFLFWLGILIIYISNGREFLRKNSFILGMIIFYLVTYFFVEVTARIFESVIILVLLASLELKNKYKIIVVGLFIIFIIYQFISKIDIPYFGYGI
ncbi:EpsG family protein [Aliarcobacter butzleri]|uniref:EpsG family protein n=1 Tax=Aliarcobacter butzleri TaxID=28197 RepID=UPI0021B34BA7|nr:EpsG family protein [Aliarcobacter butzleri]MCT7604382.1 EpsG family protein [Aliarcobacter butzleri]